jgi:hypothetical protein
MSDSRPGADCLDVTGSRQAHISNAIAMSHRPPADVRDNLHVSVAVQIEAAPGSNLVVVPHHEGTQRSVCGVALRNNFEMVPGLEPAEVTAVECRRCTNLQHDERLRRSAAQLAWAAPVGSFSGIAPLHRSGQEFFRISR